MQFPKDYSTCVLCGEPVLSKVFFIPFKGKAICCDCLKELEHKYTWAQRDRNTEIMRGIDRMFNKPGGKMIKKAKQCNMQPNIWTAYNYHHSLKGKHHMLMALPKKDGFITDSTMFDTDIPEDPPCAISMLTYFETAQDLVNTDISCRISWTDWQGDPNPMCSFWVTSAREDVGGIRWHLIDLIPWDQDVQLTLTANPKKWRISWCSASAQNQAITETLLNTISCGFAIRPIRHKGLHGEFYLQYFSKKGD